ncbi:hypothetical protein HAX54_021214 [Datura stramonium]|uniref:Uncharacterized protein n=1 Tax=Datura stramonium TaxID=4076 RepID=A0ABS8S3B8_DATST|nr:hypothetical protein [Datura stramonium]
MTEKATAPEASYPTRYEDIASTSPNRGKQHFRPNKAKFWRTTDSKIDPWILKLSSQHEIVSFDPFSVEFQFLSCNALDTTEETLLEHGADDEAELINLSVPPCNMQFPQHSVNQTRVFLLFLSIVTFHYHDMEVKIYAN